MQLIVAICTVLTLLASAGVSLADKSPVVMLPGIAGSQLWAFEKNPAKRYQIWVSLEELYIEREVVNTLKLDYNTKLRMPVDNTNLETGPGYYGDPRAVEYLDDSMTIAGSYMITFVDALVKADAYFVRNKTIRAAPFDFRFTPREKPEIITDLKALIEDTFIAGGDKKVTIMAHSFGAANGAIFLNKMTAEWRAKYIKRFISISGPFGGSVKSLKCQISGDSVTLPLMYASTMRPLLRSMSGVSALLPHPEVFGELPLILADHRNYTGNEYKELYTDAQTLDSYFMWEDNRGMYRDEVKPPNDVEPICIYGYGLKTMQQLDYRNGRFPNTTPKFIYGEGDGTVNMPSLQLCHKWDNVQVHALEGAEHFEIVSDKRFLKTMIEYLLS